MNIKKNKSTVCILTAGTGSRMGYYSNIINKSLLPVNNKAIISHIIELFNPTSEFIIGLGYKSYQVKSYLKIAHPNINFKFVKIKNFMGKNSGPGLSLMKCKKYLNKKFFFISCDTLLSKKQVEKINLKSNFVGVANVNKLDRMHYCNFVIKNNKIIEIFDKSIPKKIDIKSFIGFCFIKDFKLFWQSLSYELKNKSSIEISSGLKFLVENKTLYSKTLKWYDVGSFDLYKKLTINRNINQYDFSKKNELIYFINNKVIKFDNDSKKNINKYKKFLLNKKIFPNNVKIINNFLYYDYLKGHTFYKKNSIRDFSYLLKWLNNKLWIDFKKNNKISLLDDSINFYKVKTIERVKKYLNENKKIDLIQKINNIKVKNIDYYIKKIKWEYLFDVKKSFIHGDLQFDNIIINKKNITLIDWRETYGSNIKFGDIYYDLAKLYGGMHINYDYIKLNKMHFQIKNKHIVFNITRRKIMKHYKVVFENFLTKNDFDFKKVKLLMALIFLNMSPLHNKPFNHILFSYSKILLKNYFDKYD